MRMYFAAWAVLPIAVVLGIFSGGCAEKQAHAKVPAANVAPAKPIPNSTTTPPQATPPSVKTPSNPDVDLPETNDVTPNEPVKPATPPPKPKPEPAAPVRTTPPPQISPQLSPADQAAFEQKTNENIAGAEKNLRQASGHSLNSVQNDLVDKIKGFLAQAHAAVQEADLARAQNLSQKAYLLSVELVNSL
jgi:outer membrane biosynthesis protein TonB